MNENSNLNIQLRAFEKSDKSELTKLLNNKKIWDNVRDYLPFPYTEKDAENFIDISRKQNPQYNFIIELNNELVGVIALGPQKDVYRLTAEIGYWVGEPYWGKGIATQAVKMIVEYGFETLKLVRIHTGVFAHNESSMRVLEKAGFKKEAVFEKSVIKNGVIEDEHRYAIINEQFNSFNDI